VKGSRKKAAVFCYPFTGAETLAGLLLVMAGSNLGVPTSAHVSRVIMGQICTATPLVRRFFRALSLREWEAAQDQGQVQGWAHHSEAGYDLQAGLGHYIDQGPV